MCVCVRTPPGAELAERLERGGRHVAEGRVVTQQQEGQHLEPAAAQKKKKKNRRLILLLVFIQCGLNE